MDSKPLVSVVMPIYGVEKFIENSVRSVIDQTYDNIELILVDDGSPDKSVEIAESVLKEHDYPYQLIRQANQGQGEARNTGIRKAKGKWILFLDSDDIILPETIFQLVQSCEDENGNNCIDLVFSRFHLISSFDDIIESEKYFKTKIIDGKRLKKLFLLRKRIVLVAGTLFKRDLILREEIFFENIPWSEDQHFVWKYLSCVDIALFVEKAYYQYLQHPGSIMSASGIDKMILSYPIICGLTTYYDEGSLVGRFLVPRWVLGTLNAAGRTLRYAEWTKLFFELDAKNHLKRLLRFPSVKVKALSVVGLISPKSYYLILSKRRIR